MSNNGSYSPEMLRLLEELSSGQITAEGKKRLYAAALQDDALFAAISEQQELDEWLAIDEVKDVVLAEPEPLLQERPTVVARMRAVAPSEAAAMPPAAGAPAALPSSPKPPPAPKRWTALLALAATVLAGWFGYATWQATTQNKTAVSVASNAEKAANAEVAPAAIPQDESSNAAASERAVANSSPKAKPAKADEIAVARKVASPEPIAAEKKIVAMDRAKEEMPAVLGQSAPKPAANAAEGASAAPVLAPAIPAAAPAAPPPSPASPAPISTPEREAPKRAAAFRASPAEADADKARDERADARANSAGLAESASRRKSAPAALLTGPTQEEPQVYLVVDGERQPMVEEIRMQPGRAISIAIAAGRQPTTVLLTEKETGALLQRAISSPGNNLNFPLRPTAGTHTYELALQNAANPNTPSKKLSIKIRVE